MCLFDRQDRRPLPRQPYPPVNEHDTLLPASQVQSVTHVSGRGRARRRCQPEGSAPDTEAHVQSSPASTVRCLAALNLWRRRSPPPQCRLLGSRRLVVAPHFLAFLRSPGELPFFSQPSRGAWGSSFTLWRYPYSASPPLHSGDASAMLEHPHRSDSKTDSEQPTPGQPAQDAFPHRGGAFPVGDRR
jgi:hypothetical protein